MGRVFFVGGKLDMKEPLEQMPENFEDATWSQIIKACQHNAVPDTWVPGDQKTMTIDGTDYPIDIIGKNHDDYSDGSDKAPLTFQLHGVYATSYKMKSLATNMESWKSSDIRNTNLPAILAKMPAEVQSAIREVNKLTSGGNLSTTISVTADKLFLLSEIEIFGTTTYSVSGEGSQYAYYAAGNDKNKATSWWARSPYSADNQRYCYVYMGTASHNLADSKFSVAFAFCF